MDQLGIDKFKSVKINNIIDITMALDSKRCLWLCEQMKLNKNVFEKIIMF